MSPLSQCGGFPGQGKGLPFAFFLDRLLLSPQDRRVVPRLFLGSKTSLRKTKRPFFPPPPPPPPPKSFVMPNPFSFPLESGSLASHPLLFLDRKADNLSFLSTSCETRSLGPFLRRFSPFRARVKPFPRIFPRVRGAFFSPPDALF